MGKDKLRKFAALHEYPHVVEPSTETAMSDEVYPLKGKWSKELFGNDNPIILELGCGKGEYTVGLARKYKDYNFIGVDIKGNRIWRGATTCLEEGIKNAGFLRTKVDFIDKFFAKDEVAEIWLTFSDPQPAKPRKRLTSPLFIERYRKILRPGGIINIKTDSDLLFEYTLEQIEEHNYDLKLKSWDVYGELLKDTTPEITYKMGIRTYYESKWLEMDITTKYAQFGIDK